VASSGSKTCASSRRNWSISKVTFGLFDWQLAKSMSLFVYAIYIYTYILYIHIDIYIYVYACMYIYMILSYGNIWMLLHLGKEEWSMAHQIIHDEVCLTGYGH
jgi:hypothetical protein